MNLEFSDDQKFVQKTARDYLTENAPLSLCRAVLEGNKPYDPTLWKGVAEMGWLGTAVPEVYGGAGLSHLELVLIAQELGRALAPIPFSSSVYLATEAILQAGSEAQKQKYLPKLASGETIGTLALAEGLGDFDAASATGTSFDGKRVSGTKVPVQRRRRGQLRRGRGQGGRRPFAGAGGPRGRRRDAHRARELRPEPPAREARARRTRRASASAPQARARRWLATCSTARQC